MLKSHSRIKICWEAGDTGPLEEQPEDYEKETFRKCSIMDENLFISKSMTSILTHFTGEMSIFAVGPSDYDLWKAVFNRIEEIAGIRYFACIRSKTGVYARFSSTRPLGKALSVALSKDNSVIPYWFESLMMFAPLFGGLGKIMLDSEDTSIPVEDNYVDKLNSDSYWWDIIKKCFCCKCDKSEEKKSNDIFRPDTVYDSLDLKELEKK